MPTSFLELFVYEQIDAETRKSIIDIKEIVGCGFCDWKGVVWKFVLDMGKPHVTKLGEGHTPISP